MLAVYIIMSAKIREVILFWETYMELKVYRWDGHMVEEQKAWSITY